MTLKNRSGFTLVEVAVAMGLMAVVMAMVVTAFLLINEYSSRETGFFDTMTDLTEAEKLFTSFVNDHDDASCRFTVDENDALCIYNQSGVVYVQNFDKPWLTVRFSRMEAYNTDYCDFYWTAADGAQAHLNFNTFAWSAQAWSSADDQSVCNALYEAFVEADTPVYSLRGDGGLMAFDAQEMADYEADSARYAADLAEYERLIAAGEAAEHPGDAPLKPTALLTLAARAATADNPGISYYEENGEWFCRLTPPTETATAAVNILLSLPPRVLNARCEVLAWGKAQSLEGVRFAIASAVLRVRDMRTGEESLICYVKGESSTTYVTGFLRRSVEHSNLLLATGSPPLVVDTLTDVEFVTTEGLGVLCRMDHTMRGEDRVFDVLAPTRAAVLA